MRESDIETLVSTESLTLMYVPTTGILWHRIHKFVCGPEFRAMLQAGLLCMRERGATKWLSDNRNNNALPPTDEAWIHGEWFPQVMEAGWKFWAIVPPHKFLGEKNMRRYAKKYETAGLVWRVFGEPEEAMRWLEAQ